MKKIKKFLKLIVSGFVTIIVLFILQFTWGYFKSTPNLTGEIKVKGLTEEVTVARDTYGVPHIYAPSKKAAYFAFGYVQAQDRFFQMDLTRRLIKGRLSELVGKKAIKVDTQNRMKGFNRLAENLIKNSSAEVQEMLQAFTDGVNQRLSEGSVSPEYYLLMLTPEPWQISDCMAAGLAMTDSLVLGYERELARTKLLKKITVDQLKDFFPEYPNRILPSVIEDLSPSFADREKSVVQNPTNSKQQIADGELNGSNAWYIAGENTTTGKAFLANDPHLGFSEPGPFYLVHLAIGTTPSFSNIIGAALPGVPFIVIGRNDYLAWTNTTNILDTEDILTTDQPVVETYEEEILVRDKLFFQASEKVTVRLTDVGPVLDRKSFELEDTFDKDPVLRSAALSKTNGILQAVYDMNFAKNVNEFVKASKPWTAPMTNILVVDVNGNQALVSTGQFPLRDKDGNWTGYVDWADQPNFINLNKPFMVTANNLITGSNYKNPVPGFYAPYRKERIDQMLSPNKKYDMESIHQDQVDQVSIPALRIQKFMLAVLSTELTQKAKTDSKAALDDITITTAIELIKNWNGSMAADSGAALVYQYWLKDLSEYLYQDEIGKELYEKISGPRTEFLDYILSDETHGKWCDDVTTADVVESCSDIANKALKTSLVKLTKKFGSDATKWMWGSQHQAVFKHPLLSPMPIIGGLFTVKQSVGGDADTVFPTVFTYDNEYIGKHGPGLRVIYDFSDLNKSQYVMPLGQSGHPKSPYFSNMLPMWLESKGFEIRTDMDLANSDLNIIKFKPEATN